MMLSIALLLFSVTTPDASVAAGAAGESESIRGERVDPALLGPGVLETMDDVMKRERERPPPRDLLPAPPPQVPRGRVVHKPRPSGPGTSALLGGGGTAPVIGQSFAGPDSSDPGAGWVPPDSVGAVGPTHFVAAVNKHLSVYVKSTGVRVLSTSLTSFFGVAVGDPRVAYDPHSGRFIVLGSDFGTRIYVAVSSSSDPTGSWFKFAMVVSAGADAGFWPDYPTLGVDANGIYTAAYMVGGGLMSVFAIDKAPLVAPVQSQGAVWAFRQLQWEGAIHPCVTYGTPAGEYLVSRASGTSLRLRRLDPPLTGPTAPILTTLGFVTVPSTSAPPDAPNLGSPVLLSTLDGRLMNAVYRNGSVWTAHAVDVGGRAGCRWYQLGTSPIGLAQTGSVDDPELCYFFPGISVNAANEMALGFSGSSASSFAGAYATGRKAADPVGQTGAPFLVKAGEASYDHGDPSRWGDYSLTSVDPVDDSTFWTIQEYARTGNTWGTWIGELRFSCPARTSFCLAAPNTFDANGAIMDSSGSTSVAANDLVLITYSVPPLKTCLYFYGQDQSPLVPFGNGWRCINNPLFRLPVIQSNVLGDALWSLDLNALPPGGQISAGQSFGFQCWYRNPEAGGANFNASDGLRTQWCP